MSHTDPVPEASTHPVSGGGTKLHACTGTPWPFPGVLVDGLCGRPIRVAVHYVPGTFSYVNPDQRCAQCAARVEETTR